MSPQRKAAPCARTARRKDDVFRTVSWLAGHNPSSPSRALFKQPQWHTEEGLTAYSCGRSSGFGCPYDQANRTEFPLLINLTSIPNANTRNQAAFIVKAGVDHPCVN
jgi:hypothetical protein